MGAVKKAIWIIFDKEEWGQLHGEAAKECVTLGELVHEYILLGLKWTRKAELAEQLEKDEDKARQELVEIQNKLDELHLKHQRQERNRKQQAYRDKQPKGYMHKRTRFDKNYKPTDYVIDRKQGTADNNLGTGDNKPGTV